ncbi:MAG: hypothetical protein AABX98_06395, partial [Nanoarchaeota archaeon]
MLRKFKICSIKFGIFLLLFFFAHLVIVSAATSEPLDFDYERDCDVRWSQDSCLNQLAGQSDDSRYCDLIEKDSLQSSCYRKAGVIIYSELIQTLLVPFLIICVFSFLIKMFM